MENLFNDYDYTFVFCDYFKYDLTLLGKGDDVEFEFCNNISLWLTK